MQTLDITSLRENLRPLDLIAGDEASASPAERQYFEYYHLNFAEKLDRVNHCFGYLPHNEGRIACHYFKNEGAQRSCFIVHGYFDHSGLYYKFIDYLLHRGCNVVVFDLPGHGLSTGEPASIDSFGSYVLAFRRVLDFFAEKIETPWYAVAQSMGGAITMDFLLAEQVSESSGPFEKVLLLAPLVRPTGWAGIKMLHLLLRSWRRNVKRRFVENSHDTEFIELLNNDPLQSRVIPVKWVTALIAWERRFRSLSWSETEVLVVQGTGDTTVDWRHNLSVIANKFPRAKFMKIAGARHHLVGEGGNYFDRLIQSADIYFERRKTPRG